MTSITRNETREQQLQRRAAEAEARAREAREARARAGVGGTGSTDGDDGAAGVGTSGERDVDPTKRNDARRVMFNGNGGQRFGMNGMHQMNGAPGPGQVPGDRTPPNVPPLPPQLRQRLADEVVQRGGVPFPPPRGPLSTKNGGMPEGDIHTPTDVEAARAYEHLTNAYDQAMQRVMTAGSPQERIAAQRALQEARDGMHTLQQRMHMQPDLKQALGAVERGTQQQLDVARKQHVDDLNATKTALDPEVDDTDAIALAARNGDAAAQRAWSRTRAEAEGNGDADKLKKLRQSERLAGEDPEKARNALDKAAFARTPEERERLIKEFDEAGGVSQKAKLDELKVQDAVLKFADSKRSDADRAALKQQLEALPDDNYFKHKALDRIKAEERALAHPLKPGERGVAVEGTDSLVRDVREEQGGARVDAITRGLTASSSPTELANAKRKLAERGTSETEKDALAKVSTQEALARIRDRTDVDNATKALVDEAKANNPYARAALAQALRSNGKSTGEAGAGGVGGAGEGGADAAGPAGDVSMGRDDRRVRLPEMNARERAAMLHAAADAFADGKMSRDEAHALSTELARTNDRELAGKLQKAIDTGIAAKRPDVLAGLADTMALSSPSEQGALASSKLVDTFMKGSEMPDFPREVGKLGRAAQTGAGAAVDAMARLSAKGDDKGHAAFAEGALVRAAKSGHAEMVTKALTDVPLTQRDLDNGYHARALGRAAAEWKDGGAKVNAKHKDEVLRTLEDAVSRAPSDHPRKVGPHEGAVQGLAAVPEHWRGRTFDALVDNVKSPAVQRALEDASPRLSKQQATELKGQLVDKLKHSKDREETIASARAVGQLGRWANASDVKEMAAKLGKMQDNADGFSAMVNLMSRVEDPAAKQAANDALFDKNNRWESLDKLSHDDRKKLAAYVNGSGDDALSADVQKLIYDAGIRPPVAGLMKQWGVEGTPEQRRDKALQAKANYGDDAVRKLGARAALWNSLSHNDRADLLGLDKSKLTEQQKAQIAQTVDVAQAVERAADGTLHQGGQRFLLENLEGKTAALQRKHAGELSDKQGEMRSMLKTRERDLDAMVKYAEKGVSFGDDVGHVLSYLNPGNLIYGRGDSAVDEFASNQAAQVRNLQGHDKRLEDKAREIASAAQQQLFTSTSSAAFERESAMAEGNQRQADLIALDQWKQHGDHLRALQPDMYSALHKRGDGDPRNEGAWERLRRNGAVNLKNAPEYTGSPDEKRTKALATLSKPLGYGAEADAVRKHALHTFDTDPSLQRMQESAGLIARGMPDVAKMLQAGQKGRKYQEYVDDLRNRAEPMQKALEQLKQDAPRIKDRIKELEAAKAGADDTTRKELDARIKGAQGMLDMIEKSDGAKALLDTVMDKSQMDADTWGNWLANEGPKIAAGLAVGVGAAVLCVASCGTAAPFVVVALAGAAGGAAGGLLGYEGAREGMHALRNNFDPDVTSGRLKWGDRSRLGSYVAGEKLFDEKTGKYREQNLVGDVVKPYAEQFARDFALSALTAGIAGKASGMINKVLARNPAMANRLGASMAQLEATAGKEGAKRALSQVLGQAAKQFPKELADEAKDEIMESALEKALNQVDPMLGMASSVLVGTGKGVSFRGGRGGAGGLDYDGSRFADTVKSLEAGGFKVTHDAKAPGKFYVDTADGPVTFSPATGTQVSASDVDGAKQAKPQPLPHETQNDPRVLRERAAASKELAQKLDDSGNLDPDVTARAKALRAESERLTERAQKIERGERVDADPSLSSSTQAETKASDAQPGLLDKLKLWKRKDAQKAPTDEVKQEQQALEKVPGFAQLSPQQQGIAKEVLGLKNDPVFHRMGDKMSRLLKDPRFTKADAATQAKTIQDVLADTRRIHGVLPAVGAGKAVPYTAKSATATPADTDRFRTSPLDAVTGATAQELSFDEGGGKTSTVRVVRPNNVDPHASGRLPTDKELADALAKLPPDVRAQIKTVVLNPVENPDDPFWQQQPGFSPDHKSAMTASSRGGTVTVYPVQSSYDAQQTATTLAHEVGHFVSKQGLARSPNDPAWDQWKQAAAKEPSVSRYAQSNAAEDFSETYALYQMTKGTPQHDAYRRMMPERFAILDRLSSTATTTTTQTQTKDADVQPAPAPSRATTLRPDPKVDDSVRKVRAAARGRDGQDAIDAASEVSRREGIAFRSLSGRDIAQILDGEGIKARGTDGSQNALRDTVYYDGNGKSPNSAYTPTTEVHPSMLAKGDTKNYAVLDAKALRADGKYRTRAEMPKEPDRAQWVNQQAHTATVGDVDGSYIKRVTLNGTEYSSQDLQELTKRVQKFDAAFVDGDSVTLTQSQAPFDSVTLPKAALDGVDLDQAANGRVRMWIDPNPPGGGGPRLVHSLPEMR